MASGSPAHSSQARSPRSNAAELRRRRRLYLWHRSLARPDRKVPNRFAAAHENERLLFQVELGDKVVELLGARNVDVVEREDDVPRAQTGLFGGAVDFLDEDSG